MFTLSQFVEKKLEKLGSMCVCFVDLEKAFDTVSREMVMAPAGSARSRCQDGGGNI